MTMTPRYINLGSHGFTSTEDKYVDWSTRKYFENSIKNLGDMDVNVMNLETVVLAEGFHFLEGPRWRDGWLWVSDLVDRKVYRISLEGTVEFVVDVPGRPSGLGFLPDDTPLVVSMRDRKLYRIRKAELELHADLSTLTVDELNDMVVDEMGRAYVGCYGFETPVTGRRREGSLLLVEPTGTAKTVQTGLEFPNGCLIFSDGRRLVLAETFGRRLTAFDITDDGRLGERSLFADLGKICPDGICQDTEGGVWVAAAERPEFVRVLEGGRVTHRIRTPGRQAVACQLGGPDGQILFCLTAEEAFEDVAGCAATARVETVRIMPP